MHSRPALTFFLAFFCYGSMIRAESTPDSERCAFSLLSDHTLYLLQQLGASSNQSRQALIDQLFEIYKQHKLFVQLDEQDELEFSNRTDEDDKVLNWLKKLAKILGQKPGQLPAFSTVILSSFSFLPPSLLRTDFQINVSASEADIHAYFYEEALLLPIRQKRRERFIEDLGHTSRRTRLKWTFEAFMDPPHDQFIAILNQAEAFILRQDPSRLEKVSKIRLINQYQRDWKLVSPKLFEGVIDIVLEDSASSLLTSLNRQLVDLERFEDRHSKVAERFLIISVLLQMTIGADPISHRVAFEHPEKIESLLLWLEEFFSIVPDSDFSVARIGFNVLPINHISGAGEKTLWISIHSTKRELFVWLSRIRVSSSR